MKILKMASTQKAKKIQDKKKQTSSKTIIYLSIGSNIGNKKDNIERAIWRLCEKCDILDISNIYFTEPVGYKEQDWFLNCHVKAETALDPDTLLSFCKSIERKLKRKKTIRNGPRIIDIDIIFFGNKIVDKKELIIPHPRMHERKFVLVPLNEICPNKKHPILNKKVKDLLAELKDESEVRKALM